MLWASPWTLIGLGVGLLGLATGGRARRRGRILEFYGGAVAWLLKKLPNGQFTLAMTWGHVVLGQTAASLDVAREHEMVHVGQYERWGPCSRLSAGRPRTTLESDWTGNSHWIERGEETSLCSASSFSRRHLRFT